MTESSLYTVPSLLFTLVASRSAYIRSDLFLHSLRADLNNFP